MNGFVAGLLGSGLGGATAGRAGGNGEAGEHSIRPLLSPTGRCRDRHPPGRARRLRSWPWASKAHTDSLLPPTKGQEGET